MGSSVSFLGDGKKIKLNSVAVTSDSPKNSPKKQEPTEEIRDQTLFEQQKHNHSNRALTEQSTDNHSNSESPIRPDAVVKENSPNQESFANVDEEERENESEPHIENPSHSPRSNESDTDGVAEMFANTALSLGMDDQDLLFNLMYFSEGQPETLGSVMNTLQTETLALHSENNTPYKLKPASSQAVNTLNRCQFELDVTCEEKECQVCKDVMDEGCEVIQLPACRHVFHEECLLRWIKLQGWCPICRAQLDTFQGMDIQGDSDNVGLDDSQLMVPGSQLSTSMEYIDLAEDRHLRDAQQSIDKKGHSLRNFGYDRNELRGSAKNLFGDPS